MEILIRCLLLGSVIWGVGCSCSDPLIDHRFRGDPLFSFDGQVVSYQMESTEQGSLRVSLFWSKTGNIQVTEEQLLEQPSASVGVQFPNTFRINVFYPPQSQHFVHGDFSLAVALILVYQDTNHNGRFDAGDGGDILVGAAKNRALFYASRLLDASESPINLDIPAGFSLAQIPVDCTPDPQPDSTPDCAPYLGVACVTDLQCHPGGRCLNQLNGQHFPGGYCVKPGDLDDCIPIGVYTDVEEFHWLRGCTSEADCPRSDQHCLKVELPADDPCALCWPNDKAVPPVGGCFTPSDEQLDENCGQQLGEPCAQNRDCRDAKQAGECLFDVAGIALDGGYCALSKNTHCFALGAVLSSFFTSFWLQRCRSNDDCRTNEGYECDLFSLTCMPQRPVLLVVEGESFSLGNMNPLCH